MDIINKRTTGLRHKIHLLLLFTLLFLLPSLAFAASVGPNIPIASKANDQQNPYTIYLTDPDNPESGLWFVVWEDWRNSSTTGADIYGQFIDADGNLCGSELLISNGKTTLQIGTGNGVQTHYTGTLQYRPVTKKSVSVTAGALTCSDSTGAGSFGGDCIGTVNYTTGALNITFTSPPLNGVHVNVEYTSNKNQTSPRAAYRIEDGKIIVVWQDTRPNYVFYNTIAGIDFSSCTPGLAGNGATLGDADATIGYNPIQEYSYSTLLPLNVTGEVIATADGITSTFSDHLSHYPVLPGSVLVTDGTQTLLDNGFGQFTGDGTGSVNYNLGFVSVSFKTPPGTPHSNTETIGLGSGSPLSQTFSGTLTNTPIQPNSITITAGSQTCSDNSTGGFTGGCTGTITYATGAYSVTFDPAPGSGVPVRVTYNYLIAGTNITADYTYFSSFPPGKVAGTDTLVSRRVPNIYYDEIGDQFWITWKETRSVRHLISELCFAGAGRANHIASWNFDDSDFVGYVMLDGGTLAEEPSFSGVTGADVFRNEDTSTARIISTSITPLSETREYESFQLTANPDVSCDSTSPQCLIVFEGIRTKQTLTCTCVDNNANKICDLADTVTDSLTSASFDDGKVHIYGITDNYVDLPMTMMKLDASSSDTHYPSVGFDPITQRFLTAWEDLRDGSNTKVYGQLIQSGGGLYNSNFIISYEDTNGDGQQDTNVANSKQTKPFVSYDPVNQRFFVVWQDGRNTMLSLENLDIYGQKVDAEGSLRGDNYAVFTLPYNQYIPTIAYNTITDQFLAVWKDARNTDKGTCSAGGGVGTGTSPCGSDVYGQRFTLGNPALTLLNPDNTPLAPPLLSAFENPPGSGSVDVGLSAPQSFKVKNTGDTTIHIDCINGSDECNPTLDIDPFSFDGLPSQLTTCCDGQTIDLVPSAELTFTVRFTPVTGGSFNKFFVIKSDGGSPQVNLSALSKEPDITIFSPAVPFNFGNVFTGSTKQQTFVIKNIGLATLVISSVSNPVTPFSIVSDGCSGQNVTPGSTCSIVVKFAPAGAGGFNSQFTINSNDPDTPTLNVSVLGTGVAAPHMQVSPTTINFGNVQLGHNGQQDITIGNNGTAALTILAITPPVAPFSIVNNTCPVSPATLAIGGNCQLTVQFAPTVTGGVSSSIGISSDDPSQPVVTINLSGTGVATPQISVSPGSFNFASTPVGSTASQNFQVTNIGTTPLNITGFTNPTGDFSIQSSNCVGTLSPTLSCNIAIAFSPISAGFKLSSFQINSNDPVTPVFTVLLSGAGSTLPAINVSPAAVDFGSIISGLSGTQNITVTNSGSANLTISSVSAPASPFSITSNGCLSASLAHGASCQITVQFAPTATGPFSSTITIASNDPTTPNVDIDLTGTATAPAKIQVLPPSPVDFGNVVKGTVSTPQTITVTNIGGANLIISAVKYPQSPFRVKEDNCTGATLGASESCAISVVFNPISKGNFNAYYMFISSNDASNPKVQVTLTGVGINQP